MLQNTRILSVLRPLRGFHRSLATQPQHTIKNKSQFSDVNTRPDLEGWNNPETVAAEEEAKRPLTERERKIKEDRERLNWAPTPERPRSRLHVFNSGENNMSWLQFVVKPWNFSISGIKKYLEKRKEYRDEFLQSYSAERIDILGPDLAVAHFSCMRGAKVRFVGDDTVYTNDNFRNLPNKFDSSFLLEELAFDESPLYYAGVENIRDLEHCKRISVQNCAVFDDWCLDRLSGNNLSTLEILDLRGSTKVTYRGLSCLYRLSTLKQLLITTSDLIEWKLSIAMLEDVLPELQVITTPETTKTEESVKK